jgi:hypothetical protein
MKKTSKQQSDPLIDKKMMLERFEGKGGWTYLKFKDPRKEKTPFKWMDIKGTLDEVTIQTKIWPVKGGEMFLPVKAEIRKKLGKGAGDYVNVTVFRDESEVDVPEVLRECLDEDPVAKINFSKLSRSKQLFHIRQIESAKKEETQVEKIAQLLRSLQSPVHN